MKTVFFDIDTQIDFMFPAGALYVPGAEKLLPAIERLNHYAVAHGIPLVSDMDAHSEDDPEFKTWPPHCVVGTTGQLKPASTMVGKTAVVPSTPAEVKIDGAQQIILEKVKLDLFTNPNIHELLDKLQADHYVVYGVVTEYCVKCAVMGLLATGKPVTLITDAVETLNPADSDAMIAEFTKHGGVLQSVQNCCQADGFPPAG
jgi:nicotinamidase/pyrazinamidase